MGLILSGVIDAEPRTHLADPKIQGGGGIPDVPPHWMFERDGGRSVFPGRPFVHFLYQFFCVIGFGYPSPRDFWEVSYPGCPVEVVERARDKLRQRFEHVNIVVRCQSFGGRVAGFDCNVVSDLG